MKFADAHSLRQVGHWSDFLHILDMLSPWAGQDHLQQPQMHTCLLSTS